jgi:hypothetical protein
MAYLIDLKTFTDSGGYLTVTEKVLPFPIKRLFYIYGVDNSERDSHRHHKTIQAAKCIQGACKIYNHDGELEQYFILDKPSMCLLLKPRDWHKMYDLTPNAILMVVASEYFDQNNYIFQSYKPT